MDLKKHGDDLHEAEKTLTGFAKIHKEKGTKYADAWEYPFVAEQFQPSLLLMLLIIQNALGHPCRKLSQKTSQRTKKI